MNFTEWASNAKVERFDNPTGVAFIAEKGNDVMTFVARHHPDFPGENNRQDVHAVWASEGNAATVVQMIKENGHITLGTGLIHGERLEELFCMLIKRSEK